MKHRLRPLFRASLLAASLAALSGCMTIEQMAPPVEGDVVQTGTELGHDTAQLARGRHIYLTNCTKCHTVEPIARYSLPRWRKIIPDMAEESKLTGDQTRDLTAYIEAAHAALQLPPKPKS